VREDALDRGRDLLERACANRRTGHRERRPDDEGERQSRQPNVEDDRGVLCRQRGRPAREPRPHRRDDSAERNALASKGERYAARQGQHDRKRDEGDNEPPTLKLVRATATANGARARVTVEEPVIVTVRLKKGKFLKMRIIREGQSASLFVNWPTQSPKPSIVALQIFNP